MIWNISLQTGIQEEEVFKALSRSFEIRRFHPWCWVKSLWLSSDSNIAKWLVPLGLRTQSIKPESFSLETMVQSLPGSWCRVAFPAIPWRNLLWNDASKQTLFTLLPSHPTLASMPRLGEKNPFQGNPDTPESHSTLSPNIQALWQWHIRGTSYLFSWRAFGNTFQVQIWFFSVPTGPSAVPWPLIGFPAGSAEPSSEAALQNVWTSPASSV